MTTTLDEFTTALSDVLEAETTLTRLHRVLPGEAAIYPCGFIHPPEVEYTTLANDQMEVDVTISVFVAAVMGENHADLLAYQTVDGVDSVAAALQRNRSLGFDDVDAYAVSARPLALTEIQAYNAYGCAFTISAYIG